MNCETVILVAALAGLPSGTCALKCDLNGGVVITVEGNGCRGSMRVNGPMASGESIPVHRIDGQWLAVIKQELEQCLGGFAQWPSERCCGR